MVKRFDAYRVVIDRRRLKCTECFFGGLVFSPFSNFTMRRRDIQRVGKSVTAGAKKRVKMFLRVWCLYGSVMSGLVGTVAIIGLAAIGIATHYLSVQISMPWNWFGLVAVLINQPAQIGDELDQWFEYATMALTLLPITVAFLSLLAVMPATLIGFCYELMESYEVSQRASRLTAYLLSVLFAIPYAALAVSGQFDGMPWLWIPVSMLIAVVALRYTLRYRVRHAMPSYTGTAYSVISNLPY